MGEAKTGLVLGDGSQLTTVVAVAEGYESIPALAAAQVLSLFDLEKQILTLESIQTITNLPRESILLLEENQIRRLSLLRRRNFAGVVIILSSVPFASLLKKHYYILRYGASSSDAWESPWQLVDLLSKINKLKPLSQGNLNLLHQETQAANERIDRELEPVLTCLENINCDNSSFPNQLEYITATVENLFSKTPLARHLPIDIEEYGQVAIQNHFRTLIREINREPDRIDNQKMLLRQVLDEWRKQVQAQAEDIEGFLHS